MVCDGLSFALVLVQQIDGANEREVLHVIAPRARPGVDERQLARVRVGDQDRLKQALRVAMENPDAIRVAPAPAWAGGLDAQATTEGPTLRVPSLIRTANQAPRLKNTSKDDSLEVRFVPLSCRAPNQVY